MSDRRHSQRASTQWTDAQQHYPNQHTYTSGYHSPPPHHPLPSNGYDTLDTRATNVSYSTPYYNHGYTDSNSPVQLAYSPNSPSSSISPVLEARQVHSQPRTQPLPSSRSYLPHSQTQPYPQYVPPPSSQSQSRHRSHSQLQYPSQAMPIPHHSLVYYPTPESLSPTSGSSSQYPASPSRPFSCDQCALSFNRQHDLKRHRETHNGEKPYLCNGGCGKTFTRKDALKRHQLVKGCGSSDDNW